MDGTSTFAGLLAQRCREEPGRVACTFLRDGESEEPPLTYGRLGRRARALAALLQGVAAPGDRVLLLYPPGLEYAAAFLGCHFAGMVPVPAYPPSPERKDRGLPRLRAITADSGAAVALTTAALAARGGLDALPGLRPQATDRLDEEALARRWREPACGADDLALLQYTSGSTAEPKGVMVTHANLLHNLEWIRRRFGHTAESRGVIWLPPYHDMGLIGGLLQPLYAGFPVVLFAPAAFVKRPLRWLRAISRYRATTSGGPDFAYDLCVRRIPPEQRAGLDLSSWDVAFDGAEPVRAETLERFAAAFAPCGFRREAFYPCYGLAEATLLAAGGRKEEAPAVRTFAGESRPRVSCGTPLPDTAVLAVDPATAAPCPPGRSGEIWIAGPSVAKGYWGRPAETADAFAARTADGAGPYLRTGDLGFLDGGELFVTGRLKDLIILDGLKHHAEDLERTAEASHPALRPGGCMAFAAEAGEGHKGEGGGEQLVVAAELERGAAAGPEVGPEIETAVRQALAEQHGIRLHGLVLAAAGRLPRTTSGKPRRGACREEYEAGRLGARRRGSAKESAVIRAWLLRELAARLGTEAGALDPGAPFASHGLSSREAVGLAGDLETWLGRSLSPALLWQHPTIDALARHLAGEAAESVEAPAPAGAAAPAVGAEPIAVVGIACRFPGAADVEELSALLAAGRGAPSEAPPRRWDWRRPGLAAARWGGFLEGVDLFDAPFFGISPREAARMDPQQRVLLEVAWQALEDAGIPADRLAGTPAGVFVGVSNGDYARLQTAADAWPDVWSGTGNSFAIAANRLSYALDLRGPSLALDTACSSSLVAVHTACRSLRACECNVALAGGVNLLLAPDLSLAFAAAGMLAPDGHCKTFDARADGYGRGEGCGLVVLKRLADAERDGDRIRAVIRGSALGQDGRSNGLTAPSQAAQEDVVRRALADAGVAPEQVGYVECHGSGTPLGDLIEVQALAAVFGGRAAGAPACRLGAVKSHLGHLEAAAGVAGLIAAVLALEEKALPPLPHLRAVHPDIARAQGALEIAAAGRPWPAADDRPRICGVSSFGFGGTNAHLVLAEAPAAVSTAIAEPRPERGAHLLLLSAKTETALAELARQTAALLAEHPEESPADLCAAAATERAHLPFRLAAVAGSAAELRDRLARFTTGPNIADSTGLRSGRCRPGRAPRLAFLFTGQPAPEPGTGRALFAAEPAFRAALEECAALALPLLDRPLLACLDPEEGAAALADPAFAQASLFALEVALARLWISWGVAPAAVLGHSAGECAAACVAGALDLADGLRLAVERGRCLAALPPGGAMAAVFAGEEQIAGALAAGPPFSIAAVDIAAVNGRRNTVVSGDAPAVDALLARLEAAGIDGRRLPVPFAFHSALLEPALAPFERAIAGLAFRPPRLPLVSGLTGRPLAPGEVPGPAYWRRHLRETVRFAAGVESLLAQGCDAFLEVGPRAELTRLAAQDHEGAALWVPSLRRGHEEMPGLLDSLARLYTAGVPVDWNAFCGGRPRRRTVLPSYPFERKPYWIPTGDNTVQNPTPAPATRSDRKDRITADLVRVTARLLETEPAAIDPRTPFLEMGADSIILVTALRSFEDTYGLKLSMRQLFEELSTLDALAAHIEANTEANTEANLPPETAPAAEAPIPIPAPAASPAPAESHLNERQQRHLDELTALHVRRTRRSRELAEAHRPVLADSRAAAGFRPSIKEMFYPVTAASSHGARLRDVDGNEYVDITMGFGVHLFGHGAPFLTAALAEQLRQGIELGPRAALAGEVAGRIAAMTGMERVAFCNSGTEAVMVALRLARAATGRTRIALFADSYHGHSDLTQVRGRTTGAPWGVPAALGVPETTAADVLVLDYGDPRCLETLAAHGRDLAAVLVEPVQGRRPDLQPRELLHALRSWTEAAGVPLIFDEMVTGFRVHPAGAQGWFGVRADLATYGKVVGGGLPIGVVAGRAALLDRIDGGAWRYGDRSYPAVEATVYGGTFCQHPLAMAAANAVLRHLEEEGPALQEGLNRRSEELAARLDAVFAERGVPMRVARFGSLLRFVSPVNHDLFYYHLLARGIFVSERRHFFLSTAHTAEDLEMVVREVRESVEALQDGGFLPAPPRTVESRDFWPRRPAAALELTPAPVPVPAPAPAAAGPRQPLALSLSFFGAHAPGAGAGTYDFILEAARFADRQGFAAVWVPERHFHAFGGFSPNPAVLHAALARETSRVRLCAGSVVLPLHHPVRVAEEWALVDNLSGGRVGVAFAAGWHPRDFVLAPDAWGRHRDLLVSGIATVRDLWRGEALHLRDGSGAAAEIRLFPRPVQAELPVWITAVSSPETFVRAGELGAGVLTNLMGQTPDDLARNIALYREARAAAGHAPESGRVTVLLHTFLGRDLDAVRRQAEGPLRDYLLASVDLFRGFAASQGLPLEPERLRREELEPLLRTACARYLGTSALIGTPESCLPVLDRLAALGVDEVACLVDFGLEARDILAGLPFLDELRTRHQSPVPAPEPAKVSEPESAPDRPTAPLTDSQRLLWTLAQLDAESSAAYNECIVLRLPAPADVGALHRALQRLADRHEALRTTFAADGSAQHVAPPAPVELPAVAFAGAADPEAALLGWLRARRREAFDLAQGPLWRAYLLRDVPALPGVDRGPGETGGDALAFFAHHLIVDGWSFGVLLRELAADYRNVPEIPESRLQPRDYARLQAEQLATPALEAQENYWRGQLAGGIPWLELPADRPRPAGASYGGAALASALSPEEWAAVQQAARRAHCTPFMLLAAAYLLLLHRLTGQGDIALGVDVAGRPFAGAEGLVGYCTHLVLLRSRPAATAAFADHLAAVRRTLLDAFEHQDYPFARLIQKLGLPRDPSRPLPVATTLNLERPLALPAGFAVDCERISRSVLHSQVDLSVNALETAEGLRLDWTYRTDLFDAATVRRVTRTFQTLLAGALAHPEQQLAAIDPLTASERHQLLRDWNDTAAEPPAASFADAFAARVRATPGAVAATCDGESLTYGELDRRSGRLARRLVSQGAGAETAVALLAERSLDYLAALVAILRSGGAYLPLDPRVPAPRLARLLARCGAPLLLAGGDLLDLAAHAVEGLPAGQRPRLLLLDEELAGPEPAGFEPIDRALPPVSPQQLAYILTTSGSTGEPKGVMIGHGGFLNHLHAKIADLGLRSSDTVAQTAAPTFDVSLWQFLAALLAGGRVCIVRDPAVWDPAALFAATGAHGVTVLEVVPSLLRSLVAHVRAAWPDRPALDRLRWLIATGEALPPAVCREWMSYYPAVAVLNAYGPTECSDDVAHARVRRPSEDALRVLIGRPVPNLRLHVLDPDLRLLPLGVPGELWAGGMGVGRGYLGDPAATAQAFRPDPFSDEPGARLYRTGDRVLQRPDGELELLGRNDRQVKLRGLRIEPVEIEAALARHPAVADCAVTVWADAEREPALAAYIVLRPGHSADPGSLREFLQATLPAPLVPADFLYLEALPRTSRGKVDHLALPRPKPAQPLQNRPFVAPETPTERQIARIWQQVLASSSGRVGTQDNFFELGGDSVGLLRVASLLDQACQVRLPLRRVFFEPTVAALARLVEQRRAVGAAL